MRTFSLAALAAVPCLFGTTAIAQAGISGTYRVTSTGATAPAGLYQLAGSATWRFTGGPRRGETHAYLSEAAQGPFVEPCTDTGGSITYRISGPGSDTAAVFTYSMTMNLLRGTGVAELRLGQETIGYVTESTDRDCPAPYDGGNGNSSRDVLASGMFGLGTVGYDAWRLRRGRDGAWHIDAHQTAGDPTSGSSTATVHATLSGSLRSLRASCKVPTVRELRRATTFAQGIAVVRRAGFAKPGIGTRHIRWAPVGRLYVDELGDAPYALCGRKLHLFRS